jgi:hypothetical protein
MRTLAIGLFVLCAATAYADDIDDLEQRIDDLENEIDDLRSPRPARLNLPTLPPGWTWEYTPLHRDPVNGGWHKVPPPRDPAVELCDQMYPQPPGPGTRTLSWLDCVANGMSHDTKH